MMKKTHGEAGTYNKKLKKQIGRTKEYIVWANMKSRCLREDHPQYEYYGGRGIRVSILWLNYEVFIKDMGRCPRGLTLDRINNDGDYCKENCRWVSWKVQANNRRNGGGWADEKKYNYNSEINVYKKRFAKLIYCVQTGEIFRCAADLAKELNISREAVRLRLKKKINKSKRRRYIYYKNLKKYLTKENKCDTV